MGQSQDSSDCNTKSLGVATPQTPCTSTSVFALTLQRRKPGRPRTRPDTMRPPGMNQVPTSVPDIDDQTLGGILRKTVFCFLQTGKYDDLKYCIGDQSNTGQ